MIELENTRKRLRKKLLGLLCFSGGLGFVVGLGLFFFDPAMAFIGAIFITLLIYYYFKFKLTSEFEASLKEQVLAKFASEFGFEILSQDDPKNNPKSDFLYYSNLPFKDVNFSFYPLFKTKNGDEIYDVCLFDGDQIYFYGMFIKALNLGDCEEKIANLKAVFGCEISCKLDANMAFIYINQGHDSLALNLKTPLNDNGLDISQFRVKLQTILKNLA
ncbi:putative membrane protein [Campylobacter iguaniorum]|uniref:hypothetical protein n=1 Tax=Campylobacter iguaniorum TaxID=1244531 RepID=UPI00073A24A7|nr:hypothetical protein [Campylobacter iguaniorum]ALV23632.1 putative membrane protein [Campylobacter iguaniorum]